MKAWSTFRVWHIARTGYSGYATNRVTFDMAGFSVVTFGHLPFTATKASLD